MKRTEVRIKNLDQDYHWQGEILPVLRNINIDVHQGQFISIIGPSGCGKSTLFNVLTGLEEPLRGSVYYRGEEVTGQRGYIAYMPQRDLLFPWRNLLENVILGAEIEGIDLKRSREEARELLPLFGLEGFEEAMPGELSGGMRQRAALLRTVLTYKKVMALDEPFGALDALTRDKMQRWLLDIWRELSLTILFVTHDIEEALILADKVYVLSERPGRILEEVKVNLSRPRRTTDSEFVELKSNLRALLQTDGKGSL